MRTRLLNAGARQLPHLPARSGWVCSSCRRHNGHQRGLATLPLEPKKPYYITTPIFYVNAAPHVGHLYSTILADIHKRWQVLRGRNAILCTGTDEHGMKVQQAANKAGSDPKAFCDRGSEVFKNLAARADTSNDVFIRTTDPAHREAVQHAWFMLKERDYIYQSKHEGWYSVSDETFYPQSGVQLVVEPSTGRKIMSSIETGKEVEWTSEENYHFRLSAFQEPLLEFYHKNPQWIIPKARMAEVVQAVSSGLQDLSVSRPVERLTWGVPVPDDPSQTIYVWLDALLNYITASGYPLWQPRSEMLGGWPADVHVIGKDIVRFHCIYWPAFLLALGLELPRQVLSHAHWTLGRQKMAKSTGNVVNPFFALDRFGTDVMRYYLAHDGGIENDGDYSNTFIIERYKKGLQGQLGNLASRITRGKGWKVSDAVRRAHENMATITGGDGSLYVQEQWRMLQTLASRVSDQFDKLDASVALKTIMEAVYETNKFLQEARPWYIVKEATSDSPSIRHTHDKHQTESPPVNTTIFLCAETLRIVGILLRPYMPTKAAQLLDILGVDGARRNFEYASFGADDDYGESKMELGRGTQGVLFPPLRSDF